MSDVEGYIKGLIAAGSGIITAPGAFLVFNTSSYIVDLMLVGITASSFGAFLACLSIESRGEEE